MKNKLNLNNKLFVNTVFLYLLTFSNYIFAFITIPYQTRIIGPEAFGILALGIAFQSYFNIIFDFGFILSGTRKISENKNNIIEISKIITSITLVKCILIIITIAIILIICHFSQYFYSHRYVILLYLILSAINSLIPDYFYRGVEEMKKITYRTLILRAIATSLIFVFLRDSKHYYYVPLFQIIGTTISLVWVYFDLVVKYKIRYTNANISYTLSIAKDAFQYFISRIASTIYNATNTLILGLAYPSGPTLGLFSSAEKFRSLVSQACSPISDSFYPYMIRTKNYNTLIKTTLIIETLIIGVCCIIYLFATPICTIAFGDEFSDAGIILRYLTPLMVLTLPVYMFGFPALSALGLSKWANYSVEIAMGCQIFLLFILLIFDIITVKNICIITTISESTCLIIRLSVFFKNKRKYEEIY